MSRSWIGVIGLLLAPAFLSACAGSGGAIQASAEPAPGVGITQVDPAVPAYTEADVHFMSGMIGHHAQAIQMSRMAPSHGADAAVQRLAERIINAQEDEITLMQQWLRDRRLPVPEAKPGPMKMMHGGVEHEMMMAGMLTDAQIRQLDESRGKQFDELFLKFMIQHHQGAVSMVKDLFGSHGAGQDDVVFKLASDINVDQVTEIARMQQMLFALLLEKSS